tara:strand:+ start:57 stop:584 length:528 start_codon:yes stop_codon:yes gene_type:complete
MRNLILIIAATLALTTNAQEELARIQVIFSDGAWTDERRDSLEWEVWAEPEDKCFCFSWGASREEKSYLTDEYIAKEIDSNREVVSEYNDEFVLWYSVKRQGIYHVNARNKYTGELMGQIIVRYANGDNFNFGWVAYDHDWVLLQLFIDEEGTQVPRKFYAHCDEKFWPLGWEFD